MLFHYVKCHKFFVCLVYFIMHVKLFIGCLIANYFLMFFRNYLMDQNSCSKLTILINIAIFRICRCYSFSLLCDYTIILLSILTVPTLYSALLYYGYMIYVCLFISSLLHLTLHECKAY